jgi:hypothetical protein
LAELDDPRTSENRLKLAKSYLEEAKSYLEELVHSIRDMTGDTVVGVDTAEPGSEGTAVWQYKPMTSEEVIRRLMDMPDPRDPNGVSWLAHGEMPEIKRNDSHTISEVGNALLGKSLVTPLEAPVPNGGRPIWEMVVEDMKARVIGDMRERDKFGRDKYGVPLQAFNGRPTIIDLYQEALDITVYIRAEIEERAILERELKDAKEEIALLKSRIAELSPLSGETL